MEESLLHNTPKIAYCHLWSWVFTKQFSLWERHWWGRNVRPLKLFSSYFHSHYMTRAWLLKKNTKNHHKMSRQYHLSYLSCDITHCLATKIYDQSLWNPAMISDIRKRALLEKLLRVLELWPYKPRRNNSSTTYSSPQGNAQLSGKKQKNISVQQGDLSLQ